MTSLKSVFSRVVRKLIRLEVEKDKHLTGRFCCNLRISDICSTGR